jgi:hypothetical protein
MAHDGRDLAATAFASLLNVRLALCRFNALGLRPQARRQFAPAINARTGSELLTTAPRLSALTK